MELYYMADILDDKNFSTTITHAFFFLAVRTLCSTLIKVLIINTVMALVSFTLCCTFFYYKMRKIYGENM